MAWGIFNKIRDGAVKAYNTVVPVAKKAVEVAKKTVDFVKPLLKDTKYGKFADNVENVLKTGEDVINKTEYYGDKMGLRTKQSRPKTNKRLEELDFD